MAFQISNIGGQSTGLFGFGGGFGSNTISSFAGGLSSGISDLFASDAHQAKAEGDRIEAENYRLASQYATENVGFTEQATNLKETQLDRQIYQSLGGEQAQISGAGVSGGSSIYLLRDSASQGALTKAVAQTQGLITEEGYKQQSESYQNMAKAADVAAQAEDKAASQSTLLGGINIGMGVLSAIATLA